jgi:hypothetical protein
MDHYLIAGIMFIVGLIVRMLNFIGSLYNIVHGLSMISPDSRFSKNCTMKACDFIGVYLCFLLLRLKFPNEIMNVKVFNVPCNIP